MWEFIGGFGGIARLATGAAFAAIGMYFVVVPLERADAVKGKVDEYRATSAEAQLDETQRQLHAGSIVIDAYQVQLKNALAKEKATSDDLENQIRDNEALRKTRGRSDGLDDADVKFLLDSK